MTAIYNGNKGEIMATNQVLKERYEQLCATPSDIHEHLPVFVQAVKDTQAKKVIELGVRYGVSTIAWLHALENQGHLWSVDCSFPVPASEYKNPDWTPNYHPTPPGSLDGINLLDHQGPLGVQEHWSFFLGYDIWPSILEALPKKNVDIIFIDTNHVYEETLVELDLYYPRVRKGGRIFLHDTAIEITGNATTPQPPFPVRTAMEEFCDKNDLKFENNPRCSGLGTIFV